MSQATRAYTPCVQALTLQRRCDAPRVTWPWRALLPTLLQRAKGMSSWAFSEGRGSVPALPRLWGHWSYPPSLSPSPLHQSCFFPPCPTHPTSLKGADELSIIFTFQQELP